MPLLASIQGIDPTGDKIEVWGKIIPSGNYTTNVGGDTLNLTRQIVNGVAAAVLDPNFSGVAETVFAQAAPVSFDVWSQGGNLLRQYVANLANATSPANLQVKISASATFGSEQGTGAYPGHSFILRGWMISSASA